VLSYVRLDASPKAFYDNSANGEKRFYRTKMLGVADTNLVWIPPGTFLMGSLTDEQARGTNEGPQILVTLTQGFLMGRFEVRNSDWLAYMTNLIIDDSNLSNYLQRPVRSVRWDSATNYCGLKTAYELAHGFIPPGWSYRLPTEAEWEYACRAGSTTPFAIGTGTELRNDAVRQDASFNGAFPYPTNSVAAGGIVLNASVVGSYLPNAFGLYDMHGGVREWCLDTLGFNNNPLPGGTVTNLVGSVGSGFSEVRGGSNATPGSDCRSARRQVLPITSSIDVGFRVVLVPPDES